MAADVILTEKLDRTVKPERASEPDFATAMKWTTAFYEESLDSEYGVAYRRAFEARLRDHFERGPSARMTRRGMPFEIPFMRPAAGLPTQRMVRPSR